MPAVPTSRWTTLRQILIALLLFRLWRAGRLCHAPPPPLPTRTPRLAGPPRWRQRLHAPHPDLGDPAPLPTRACRHIPR
ncbi:hypothetical protein ACFVMC_27255 [Nocardia sp. NPDC127579]|uniref:hypothetical protein n=1 Tax=Nocardia sp. NPDC127579 TaxID=3345402 RepID=UPI00363A8187